MREEAITMSTSMTIAIATDDGTTISSHFGRARYFEVVTVQDGAITKKERREKPGHHSFAGQEHHDEAREGVRHGFESASTTKHTQMAETIKDCQVMLARGMGAGAYEGMRQHNIRPIITDIRTIDEAVHAVLNGTIVDHPERLH